MEPNKVANQPFDLDSARSKTPIRPRSVRDQKIYDALTAGGTNLEDRKGRIIAQWLMACEVLEALVLIRDAALHSVSLALLRVGVETVVKGMWWVSVAQDEALEKLSSPDVKPAAAALPDPWGKAVLHWLYTTSERDDIGPLDEILHPAAHGEAVIVFNKTANRNWAGVAVQHHKRFMLWFAECITEYGYLPQFGVTSLQDLIRVLPS